MKPKIISATLAAHVGLLMLASTRFTIVAWIWEDWAWTWNYVHYSSRSGFGGLYQSDYTMVVVVTYLLAHLTGLTGYLAARRTLPRWLFGTGLSLCTLGLASFALEGSHWLWPHHRSWILSCPAASVFFAGVAISSIWRNYQKRAYPAIRTVLPQS